MTRTFPVLIGALAVVILGAAVSAAVLRSGDDRAKAAATSTTFLDTTTTPPTSTTAPPTTLAARPPTTTTTRTTLRPATTVVPVPVTTVAMTTTARPALTRGAASQALCQEIGIAVRQVVDGNTIGGGLRLVRAVNSYGDAADPSVVGPARRMISTGLRGDLEASAVATDEAHSACTRLGFQFLLPVVQCVQAPCP